MQGLRLITRMITKIKKKAMWEICSTCYIGMTKKHLVLPSVCTMRLKFNKRFYRKSLTSKDSFVEASKRLWKLLNNYENLWKLLEKYRNFYRRFLDLYVDNKEVLPLLHLSYSHCVNLSLLEQRKVVELTLLWRVS